MDNNKYIFYISGKILNLGIFKNLCEWLNPFLGDDFGEDKGELAGDDLGEAILNLEEGVNPILLELNQIWLFRAFSRWTLLPLLMFTLKP